LSFTEVMILLYLQYGGKSSDLMFTFKSYVNANSIEAGSFNAEHLLKAINGDGKAWMTREDAEVAMKFLDPAGIGRFSSKHFVELVSHENLGYMKDYNVNLCMVLYGMFASYESQLLHAKREVAAEIISEHSQVTPATSLKERLQEQDQFIGLLGAIIGPQPEKEKQDAFHEYMI
jgi:hypothetical protein